MPEHLRDDDDDWGELKYGFKFWHDEEDDEDQQLEEAPKDAKKESLLDETIWYFIHDGMKSNEDLLAHHSLEAYNKRKAERLAQETAEAKLAKIAEALQKGLGQKVEEQVTEGKAKEVAEEQALDKQVPLNAQVTEEKAKEVAEEQALDETITDGLTAEQRDKAGITADVMTAEEMQELIALMGHLKGLELVPDHKDRIPETNHEVRSYSEEDHAHHDDIKIEEPKSSVPQSTEEVSNGFSMGRNSKKNIAEEEEEEEVPAPKDETSASKGFKMGRAGKVVRGGQKEKGVPQPDMDAAYVDHEKAQTTTTTVPVVVESDGVVRGVGPMKMIQDAVSPEDRVHAQLTDIEIGKKVATQDELQSMKEELQGHPKVLKALTAGISSGVVQRLNTSLSWEIVAQTAEWAANSSMKAATDKAKGAIFGAAQNDAVLLGLKSAGSIKMRVEKMVDKEIRRNTKSQEHRVEADQLVRDTTEWIAEQIVAKQILNVTDIDLGMIVKAMVLGASRAMSRCSTCLDAAKATVVAAADIAMQDVARRVEEAKEVQENSKDFTALQAYMFAIIWGRNRAAQMGIAEDEIDWDEVTEMAKKKAEEIRKANPKGPKKDPFKAAKKVVKDALRKHANKSFDIFKKLAKESAQRVRDESQL